MSKMKLEKDLEICSKGFNNLFVSNQKKGTSFDDYNVIGAPLTK